MTVPLVVLAFFSVVAGYVGLPPVLGGGAWFQHYLEPVFRPADTLLSARAMHPMGAHEGGLALMGTSVLVAGAGILAAYLAYLRFPHLPTALAERFRGLHRLLVRKYYVDEIYDWLFVRPVTRGSERVLWRGVDMAAIDGLLVDGSAGVTAAAGNLLRRMQSGNLRSYAAWILCGAVLWLGYLLTQ
jgi:NADH-quinone oxidoreductase subunit L